MDVERGSSTANMSERMPMELSVLIVKLHGKIGLSHVNSHVFIVLIFAQWKYLNDRVFWCPSTGNKIANQALICNLFPHSCYIDSEYRKNTCPKWMNITNIHREIFNFFTDWCLQELQVWLKFNFFTNSLMYIAQSSSLLRIWIGIHIGFVICNLYMYLLCTLLHSTCTPCSKGLNCLEMILNSQCN